jgi:nucleotide-binding universal stress UspA family protein
MPSIRLAYDGSPSATAATRAAAALFPRAEAVALTVRREPTTTPAGAAAIALPATAIAEAMEALERAADEEAATVAAEGARAATAARLSATAQVVSGIANPWREIGSAAAAVGAELIVCGSRGFGAAARLALGSTSKGLLYRADRPLLIVPRFDEDTRGLLVIGYDGSAPSRDAIALAGRLLAGRDAVVVCVGESLIRHSISGRALASLPLEEVRGLTRDLDAYYGDVAADVAEEGAVLCRESGLSATAAQVEAAGSAWHGLLAYAGGSAATAS